MPVGAAPAAPSSTCRSLWETVRGGTDISVAVWTRVLVLEHRACALGGLALLVDLCTIPEVTCALCEPQYLTIY